MKSQFGFQIYNQSLYPNCDRYKKHGELNMSITCVLNLVSILSLKCLWKFTDIFSGRVVSVFGGFLSLQYPLGAIRHSVTRVWRMGQERAGTFFKLSMGGRERLARAGLRIETIRLLSMHFDLKMFGDVGHLKMVRQNFALQKKRHKRTPFQAHNKIHEVEI